jgi:hypothetical protein
MALLLILLTLLGFVFAGIGSGSNGLSDVPLGVSSAKSCSTVVTTVNGKTVRKHSCSNTSGGSTTVHSRVVIRCSARTTAGGKATTRCSPPANP